MLQLKRAFELGFERTVLKISGAGYGEGEFLDFYC